MFSAPFFSLRFLQEIPLASPYPVIFFGISNVLKHVLNQVRSNGTAHSSQTTTNEATAGLLRSESSGTASDEGRAEAAVAVLALSAGVLALLVGAGVLAAVAGLLLAVLLLLVLLVLLLLVVLGLAVGRGAAVVVVLGLAVVLLLLLLRGVGLVVLLLLAVLLLFFCVC